MPTNVAARMTLAADPGSLQGAVAAGILGGGPGGPRHRRGVRELLAEAQARVAAATPARRSPARSPRDPAAAARCPGFGHPVHKPLDPRAERILELADERGVPARTSRSRALPRRPSPKAWGKPLTMNVSMPIAAVMLDLGFMGDPSRRCPSSPARRPFWRIWPRSARTHRLPHGGRGRADRARRSSPGRSSRYDASYREQVAYLLERSAFYREKLAPRARRPDEIARCPSRKEELWRQ